MSGALVYRCKACGDILHIPTDLDVDQVAKVIATEGKYITRNSTYYPVGIHTYCHSEEVTHGIAEFIGYIVDGVDYGSQDDRRTKRS
jgi:hypothetical protein